MTVVKRDGEITPFLKHLIEDAILCAMTDTGDRDAGLASRIAQEAEDRFENMQPHITDIQSFVEHRLMCSSRKDVARAYIEYRRDRDNAREIQSDLVIKIQGLMGGTDKDLLTENANKDSSTIPTRRDLLAGVISKHYALNYILPRDVSDAHLSGDIHYHDLDYSPFGSYFNCMLIDVKGMLTNGFNLGNAEIAEPKSITTATAVVAQIIAQVASHIYGGNTINRIDEVLEKYVVASYDKHLALAYEWGIQDKYGYAKACTDKETYDAFQSLEYEINTLHTANGQTPFCTLNFGLGTSWAAKLIQKSILQVRIDGLGENKHTAVFPKLVFGIRDGVNHKKSDPNYDIKQLALKCSSKRMYPDILNYDQMVTATGGYKGPMGCRSFLNEHEGEYDGRNNMGVVTVNLPRIAIQSGGDMDKFWSILDDRMVICRKALMSRIHRLESVQAKEAPVLYMNGACGVRLGSDEYVAKIFKDGRASISLGYVGVHETLNALLGANPHIMDSEYKQALSISIIKKLREYCNTWKEDTGYAFSLYSTPSESLCNRFRQLDADEFGTLPGVTDKEYYTNSFHLDVMKNVSPYDKIDFERPYITEATGGFISYGEFPNMRNNLEALEDVWDYSYTRTPYYGTNTPVDSCFECGFEGEFHATPQGFECPKCGNNGPNKNVIRRVCGYLGDADSRPFNKGKQDEVINRVKHL